MHTTVTAKQQRGTRLLANTVYRNKCQRREHMHNMHAAATQRLGRVDVRHIEQCSQLLTSGMPNSWQLSNFSRNRW